LRFNVVIAIFLKRIVYEGITMKPHKSFEKLSREVFKLPPEERADLARMIIESLEPEKDADVEKAWQQEVSRRVRQIDQDDEKLIPYEEVKKQIRGN